MAAIVNPGPPPKEGEQHNWKLYAMIAAGIVIAYFLYEYISSQNSGSTSVVLPAAGGSGGGGTGYSTNSGTSSNTSSNNTSSTRNTTSLGKITTSTTSTTSSSGSSSGGGSSAGTQYSALETVVANGQSTWGSVESSIFGGTPNAAQSNAFQSANSSLMGSAPTPGEWFTVPGEEINNNIYSTVAAPAPSGYSDFSTQVQPGQSWSDIFSTYRGGVPQGSSALQSLFAQANPNVDFSAAPQAGSWIIVPNRYISNNATQTP